MSAGYWNPAPADGWTCWCHCGSSCSGAGVTAPAAPSTAGLSCHRARKWWGNNWDWSCVSGTQHSTDGLHQCPCVPPGQQTSCLDFSKMLFINVWNIIFQHICASSDLGTFFLTILHLLYALTELLFFVFFVVFFFGLDFWELKSVFFHFSR